MSESLVRSNLLVDAFGNKGQFSQNKDLRTNQPFRLVGNIFNSVIDTAAWTASNSGAGSAAGVANEIATLTSGTANDGYGQIATVRNARFIFAHPNLCRQVVRIPTLAAANNARRWGAFTVSTAVPQNGFFFSIDGAGALSVNRANGASVTSVASGSFNGAKTTYVLDTNVHAYEIHYFIMSVKFLIDDVLIHEFVPTTAILSGDIHLPVTAQSVNSASGTTSGTLELWAGTIMRLGRDETSPLYAHISTATTTVIKVGPGMLRGINVNNPTNAAITLYDNTAASGAIIGIIQPGASLTPFGLDYHVGFGVGLTIVTAGSPDLSVFYE